MKMQTWLRVGISCGLGIFFGIMVSQYVGEKTGMGKAFCWVGGIVGGIIGMAVHILSDPVALRVAIKRAAIETIKPAIGNALAWRPDWPWIKAFTQACILSSLAGVTTLLTAISICGLRLISHNGLTLENLSEMVVLAKIASFAGGVNGLWIAFVALVGQKIPIEPTTRSRGDSIAEYKSKCMLVIKHANPISAAVWALIGLYRITKFAAPKLPLLAKAVWQFIKRTFIYVHSDALMLVGIDCFILTIAFSLLGFSPLVGGLIGCIAGIVDYKVVSIKWLKVKQSVETA